MHVLRIHAKLLVFLIFTMRLISFNSFIYNYFLQRDNLGLLFLNTAQPAKTVTDTDSHNSAIATMFIPTHDLKPFVVFKK